MKLLLACLVFTSIGSTLGCGNKNKLTKRRRLRNSNGCNRNGDCNDDEYCDLGTDGNGGQCNSRGGEGDVCKNDSQCCHDFVCLTSSTDQNGSGYCGDGMSDNGDGMPDSGNGLSDDNECMLDPECGEGKYCFKPLRNKTEGPNYCKKKEKLGELCYAWPYVCESGACDHYSLDIDDWDKSVCVPKFEGGAVCAMNMECASDVCKKENGNDKAGECDMSDSVEGKTII